MPAIVERSVRTLIYTLHKQGKDVSSIRQALKHTRKQHTRKTIKKIISEEAEAEASGVPVEIKYRRTPLPSTLKRIEKVKQVLLDEKSGRQRTSYEIAQVLGDHPTAVKRCMQLITEHESEQQVSTSRDKHTEKPVSKRLKLEAFERAVSPLAETASGWQVKADIL